MKFLTIGDPHAQVSNLKEMQKLVDYCIEQAIENEVEAILILGDLFHNHAIIRTEVMHFWDKNFKNLSNRGFIVYVLVGNHDQQSSKELEQEMNALNVFIGKYQHIHIINSPTRLVEADALLLPYHSNHDQIYKICNENADLSNLICHQTVDGAMYDNGFYAPDGIDMDKIPQTRITSGHVHLKSYIGKCFYPGTAKWDSANDAGQEKAIHVMEINKNMMMVVNTLPTRKVVTPINKIYLNEGEEEIDLDETARNYLEIKGQSSWITKMKKKYKGQANIKTVYTDRLIKTSSKEKLLGLEDFLKTSFKPIIGVTSLDIENYVKEVVNG